MLERGLRDLLPAVRAGGAGLLAVTAACVVAQGGLLLAARPAFELALERPDAGWALLVALGASLLAAAALQAFAGLTIGIAVMRRLEPRGGEVGGRGPAEPRPPSGPGAAQTPTRGWGAAARAAAALLFRLASRGLVWSAPAALVAGGFGWAVTGEDPNLDAAIGVLLALFGGLVLAAVLVGLVARYGLGWPAIALEASTAQVALRRGYELGRGSRLLLVGLAADALGVFGVVVAVASFLVASPELSDLSVAELSATLPALVRAQASLHAVSAVIAVAVSVFAATCARALYRLTAEG